MARDISPDELDALDGFQLVDVRTQEEREAGRIGTDTAHIPFDQLHARADELDKGTLLVFYCRSGDRSSTAADAFDASGFEAASLAGGIVAWEAAGRPVEGGIGHPSGLPPR
jgi:rhodanese-related sulfurtransferase